MSELLSTSEAPRVMVVTTGGTIAATGHPGGIGHHRPGAAIVSAATSARGPGAAEPVRVEVAEAFAVDSAAMRPEHHDRLRRVIHDALDDPGIAGVVVTHGTDTMADSAIHIDACHDDPRPVVFTGAQRPADHVNPDGPGNLAAAISVAADPRFRHRGALIAFGGRVLPARGARKHHTTALDAFLNDLAGTDDTLNHWRPAPLPPVDVAGTRIDVFTGHPGFDPDVLRWAAERSADGIVLSLAGSANTQAGVPSVAAEIVAQGIPVVATSQVTSGPVEALYGGGGGGVDLRDGGVTISRSLRASQARVVLALLVAGGATPEAITEYFR